MLSTHKLKKCGIVVGDKLNIFVSIIYTKPLLYFNILVYPTVAASSFDQI